MHWQGQECTMKPRLFQIVEKFLTMVRWILVFLFLLCKYGGHGQGTVETSKVAGIAYHQLATGRVFLPFFLFQEPGGTEGGNGSGDDGGMSSGSRAVNGQGYVEDQKGGGISGLPLGVSKNGFINFHAAEFPVLCY